MSIELSQGRYRVATVTASTRPVKIADMAIPLGIVGILAVMIVPLPTIFLDLFLSINITLAIIVLFISIYVLRPLDFSVFPTVLLILTMFRLSLNVASTRLILLNGAEGTQAAGQVIRAFGTFVVGGNYAVGLVVFLILVIINFVVITKGAGRIAEVSARFTLDAMPGKQMAIDADLNAGLIGDDEAKKRRSEITREADFYGSMDGASKFVRGDAVAGILITFINVIGGIFIGVLQQGMEITDALSVYTVLTIGDGLVAQIPALVVSTAAGIIVTRVASEADMGKELSTQIFHYPKAITGAAAVLFVMGLIPGLPKMAFLSLAAVTGAIAYMNYQKGSASIEREEQDSEKDTPPALPEKEEITLLDPLAMELGYRLIPLVDTSSGGGELLERIRAMRKQFANELGIVVPPIHIKDNLQLRPEEYVLLARGVEMGRGEVMPGHFLAIDPGNAQKGLEGIPTREPAFGLTAMWIEEGVKDKAKVMGYTVVNPSIVIVTHITELIRANAHELLTRQDVQKMLDTLSGTHPKVVEELVPGQLSLGGVQKVMQNLLKERISVRDILTIVETLADHAPANKDADALTEYVRQAMSRAITKQYTTEEGTLPVMIMDPDVEDNVVKSVHQSKDGMVLAMEPSYAQRLMKKISDAMHEVTSQGYQPVLMTSPGVRLFVKRMTERVLPSLSVISSNEVTGDVSIKNLKVVSLEDAH